MSDRRIATAGFFANYYYPGTSASAPGIVARD